MFSRLLQPRILLVVAPSLITVLVLIVAFAGFQTAPSGMDGFWYSEAYGYGLAIKGRSATLYDISEAGMVAFMRGRSTGASVSLHGIPGMDFKVQLTMEGETLIMTATDTSRFEFRRPADLSAPRFTIIKATSDPIVNFDVLAGTFAKHYAFFETRGVDWASHVAALRPTAGRARDAAELFGVLSDLLSPLDDAHVSLYGPRGASFEPASMIPWTGSSQHFADVIKERYLAGPPLRAANRKVAYGRLKAGPAYLLILGMEAYATGGFDSEAEALDAALDAAIQAAGGASGLVVDLRFNGGGYDAHALRVAARFTRDRVFAYSRRSWLGDGWSEEERFFIEPTHGRPTWDGPLIVLISEATTSAAEVLALCLQALPTAVFIGEPTRGAFSDMLFKRLPNRWIYTLSNQEYRASDGLCYEGHGLPPDIEVPMDIASASQGLDGALEAAIRVIAAQGKGE